MKPLRKSAQLKPSYLQVFIKKPRRLVLHDPHGFESVGSIMPNVLRGIEAASRTNGKAVSR